MDPYEQGKQFGYALAPFFWSPLIGFGSVWIVSKIFKKKFNLLVALGLTGWIFVLFFLVDSGLI